MTQTITDREKLNRLQAVTAAAGIRGHEDRLKLATDLALTAPIMSPGDIIAFAVVAYPKPLAPTPSATAPATTQRASLPDAQAVYAARKGAAR